MVSGISPYERLDNNNLAARIESFRRYFVVAQT
jgi:hypothetical protein